MDTATVAAAGLLGFSLLIAHNVADHWVQTDKQARNKSLPGTDGRLACIAHVASYTTVLTVFAGFLWIGFDLPVSSLGFITGLVVSAISHYWADRRFTLAKLCRGLGKENFYNLGKPRDTHDNPCLGTGAYVLDQSWHWFWIFITTIVMVVL